MLQAIKQRQIALQKDIVKTIKVDLVKTSSGGGTGGGGGSKSTTTPKTTEETQEKDTPKRVEVETPKVVTSPIDIKGHWARKYITTAQAHGIISGYDENTFGAEDLITREQMAVMIVKAKKLEKFNKTETFIDSSSISSWAKTAVELASGNDIMKGYPEGDFKPQNKATRAEAVTVIVKIL